MRLIRLNAWSVRQTLLRVHLRREAGRCPVRLAAPGPQFRSWSVALPATQAGRRPSPSTGVWAPVMVSGSCAKTVSGAKRLLDGHRDGRAGDATAFTLLHG